MMAQRSWRTGSVEEYSAPARNRYSLTRRAGQIRPPGQSRRQLGYRARRAAAFEPCELKALAKYLKPDARVAIIDFHPAQSPHQDQPRMQVSKEQARALLAEAGFEPIEDIPSSLRSGSSSSADSLRDRRLVVLAKRQADAWQRVDALIVTKRPSDYAAAVTLLKDLREVGDRKGQSPEVAERLRALREAHARTPSLLAR